VATLGRESFNYTVRPNDSMSTIAGRFMGDIYSFYILARYNNMAVPKQVSGGQVLRIPGKAPPPSVMRETAKVELPSASPPPPPPPAVPAPPPPPAEPTPGERAMRAGALAQKSGDFERALAEYSKAATLDQPGAEGKATEVRRQLVSRYTLNARTAFAKQDLDGAIRSWERVLAVDPNNETAKLERQRALSLKEKVKGLGT
jgi:tetratricopeptide (TPR) repeat protein